MNKIISSVPRRGGGTNLSRMLAGRRGTVKRLRVSNKNDEKSVHVLIPLCTCPSIKGQCWTEPLPPSTFGMPQTTVAFLLRTFQQAGKLAFGRRKSHKGKKKQSFLF